jgi:hypothetical protein
MPEARLQRTRDVYGKDGWRSVKLRDCFMSTRLHNLLMWGAHYGQIPEVNTLADIEALPDWKFLRIKNAGKKSLHELRELVRREQMNYAEMLRKSA